MENVEVRSMAKTAGIHFWQIADAIGVSEATLVRWLRRPLPLEKKRQIIAAIEKLMAARG